MENADRLDTESASRSGTRRVARRSPRRFARVRTLHDSYPTKVLLVQELDGRRDRVVLKTFQSATGGDVEPLLEAEREVLMRVKHRNVVRCFGIARDAAGAPHLVLEALDGATLDALRESLQRRGTRPTLGAVLALGVGFAAALEAVHTAVDLEGMPLDLAHGHVDSSNLFLTRAGRPVLIGFSCARGPRSTLPLRSRNARHLAPEDRGGGRSSQAADVFSLASVLIEFLGHTQPTNPRDSAFFTEILATLGACLDGAPERRPSAGVLADGLAALMARSQASSPKAPCAGRLRELSAGVFEGARRSTGARGSNADSATAELGAAGSDAAKWVSRATSPSSTGFFVSGDVLVPIDSFASTAAPPTSTTERDGPLDSEPTRVKRHWLLDEPSRAEPAPPPAPPTHLSAARGPVAIHPAASGPAVSVSSSSASSSRGAIGTAWASARSVLASDADDEPTQRDVGAFLLRPPSTETSVRLSPWPRWLELLLLVTVFVTAMWVLVPR